MERTILTKVNKNWIAKWKIGSDVIETIKQTLTEGGSVKASEPRLWKFPMADVTEKNFRELAEEILEYEEANDELLKKTV